MNALVFVRPGLVEMRMEEGKELVLVRWGEPAWGRGYFLMASGVMAVKSAIRSSRLLMNIMIIKRGL